MSMHTAHGTYAVCSKNEALSDCLRQPTKGAEHAACIQTLLARTDTNAYVRSNACNASGDGGAAS